jgi:hypothetical protein
MGGQMSRYKCGDEADADVIARQTLKRVGEVLDKLEVLDKRLTRVESRLVHLMIRSGMFTKAEAKEAKHSTAPEALIEDSVERIEAMLERMKDKRERGFPLK